MFIIGRYALRSESLHAHRVALGRVTLLKRATQLQGGHSVLAMIVDHFNHQSAVMASIARLNSNQS